MIPFIISVLFCETDFGKEEKSKTSLLVVDASRSKALSKLTTIFWGVDNFNERTSSPSAPPIISIENLSYLVSTSSKVNSLVNNGIFSIATEISVTLPAVPRDRMGKSSLELIFTLSSFDVLSPDRSVASTTIFLLG